MLYLKSYCYSQHELPFVISQLIEGWDFIDKLCLYEYNYTHNGKKKDYEMEKVLHHIPENLREKLYYKKVDLTNYHIYSYNDEDKCHSINEPIQRSWFFNDTSLNLQDNDIIIDIDIDEIIYKDSYSELLEELNKKNCLLSIKMNIFFYKQNYLWSNNICTASSICKYSMIKNKKQQIKGINVIKMRDCHIRTNKIYGCHMSWVMSIDDMIKKIYSGAHTKYHHLGKKDILEKAIKDKVYVFDLKRPFNIDELMLNDSRIPIYLQKENIFNYM